MMHGVSSILQRRFAIGLAALCFAFALSAQAQQWNSYSYPADGFRASFPSEPGLQVRSVSTEKGAVELRAYFVESDPYALFVGVNDYGGRTAGTDPDTLLQNAKQGALTNSNSHLVSENKITLGIYHGLQFEAESNEAHFSARIYIVGDTMYQTLVVSPIGKIYPDTARFLDSFQLIPRVRN